MSLVYVGTQKIPVTVASLQQRAEELRQEALDKLSNGTLFQTSCSVMPYVQSQVEALLSCLVGRQTEALYQLQCWMEANESRNIPGTLMSVRRHSDGWWICFLVTELAATMQTTIRQAAWTR
jgi:hypothetical protein